jgi:hypothetical protein
MMCLHKLVEVRDARQTVGHFADEITYFFVAVIVSL